MHPILFSFKYFSETKIVSSYGVFALIGIFMASMMIVAVARRRGVDVFDSINMIALMVAGGIVVSLLVHFLIFLPERLSAKSFFTFPIGVVSWGGVLGGFFSALVISRLWKIPFLKLTDIFMPGVALGFAFGRIGCHFAGCCYGLHYDGPLSLHFMHPLAPASAVAQPLFPIQLFSAILLFCLCIILLIVLKKNLRSGFVLLGYCLLYGSGRFIVEFFRDDPRGVWLKLSDAQWYSLFLILFGGILFFHLKKYKFIVRSGEINGY